MQLALCLFINSLATWEYCDKYSKLLWLIATCLQQLLLFAAAGNTIIQANQSSYSEVINNCVEAVEVWQCVMAATNHWVALLKQLYYDVANHCCICWHSLRAMIFCVRNWQSSPAYCDHYSASITALLAYTPVTKFVPRAVEASPLTSWLPILRQASLACSNLIDNCFSQPFTQPPEVIEHFWRFASSNCLQYIASWINWLLKSLTFNNLNQWRRDCWQN